MKFNLLSRKEIPSPNKRTSYVRSSHITPRVHTYHKNKLRKSNDIESNERAFDVAKVDRLTFSWAGSEANVNMDLAHGLMKMRARARDLAFNDPLGRKYLKMLKKYVVGPTGFVHRNKAFDYVTEKGVTKKVYRTEVNRVISDGFNDWANDPNCTVTGNQTLRAFLQTAISSWAIDGECFINLVPSRKNKYGLQLQLIESSYVPEDYSTLDSAQNPIIMGIKYNRYRKPLSYLFKKYNPTEEMLPNYSVYDFTERSADDIIHLFVPEIAGQLRGLTQFAPSAYRMNLLKSIQEAILINVRSAASKVGVLTRKPGEYKEITEANIAGGKRTSDGNIQRTVQPGEVYIAPDGYDFGTFDPSYPNGAEGPFTQMVTQAVASGFDVDYSTLASNFKDVNFTSSRAASQDARLGYQDIQSLLIETVLIRIRKVWLEYALLMDAFDSANIDIREIDKINKPLFVGFRPDWVDMWKQNKADEFAVSNNLETLENVLAKRGYTLEEFIEAKKYEKELLEDAGLIVEPANLTDEEMKTIDSNDDTDEDSEEDDDDDKKESNKKENNRLRIIKQG